LIYFRNKNEYRIFKPVEITIRRGVKYKGENHWDEPIQVIMHTYMLGRYAHHNTTNASYIHTWKCHNETSYTAIFIFIHLFTCAYIVGSFLPLPPSPTLFPLPPSGPGRSCSALSLVLVKERDKHNKEDKAVLLVELRIAIQKYS
jgi:hypothetical protein